MADDDPNTPPADPPDTGEVDKWKGLSRKHESNWKAATRRVEELEAALAQAQESVTASAADRAQAAADVALARLNARLARHGLPEDAVTGLLAVLDSGRLLKDGQPNDEAISQVASAIAASTPQGGNAPPPPDPDQGKGDRGHTSKPSINELFRAAARR